ncbi:hypothetical protein QQ045_013628 [Rhodiola kirilowii]
MDLVSTFLFPANWIAHSRPAVSREKRGDGVLVERLSSQLQSYKGPVGKRSGIAQLNGSAIFVWSVDNHRQVRDNAAFINHLLASFKVLVFN